MPQDDRAPATGLLETRQGAFRAVSARRFKKDVIHVGNWRLPGGGEFAVTPARMDGWARRFSDMRAAGIRIPFPMDHSRSSADNMGWVESVYRDGDTLFCEVEVPREEDADRLGKTVREVSICVDDETDARGRVWKDVIVHISPCTDPVIPGQGEFMPLATGLAAGREPRRVTFARKESGERLTRAERERSGRHAARRAQGRC